IMTVVDRLTVFALSSVHFLAESTVGQPVANARLFQLSERKSYTDKAGRSGRRMAMDMIAAATNISTAQISALATNACANARWAASSSGTPTAGGRSRATAKAPPS